MGQGEEGSMEPLQALLPSWEKLPSKEELQKMKGRGQESSHQLSKQLSLPRAVKQETQLLGVALIL